MAKPTLLVLFGLTLLVALVGVPIAFSVGHMIGKHGSFVGLPYPNDMEPREQETLSELTVRWERPADGCLSAQVIEDNLRSRFRAGFDPDHHAVLHYRDRGEFPFWFNPLNRRTLLVYAVDDQDVVRAVDMLELVYFHDQTAIDRSTSP